METIFEYISIITFFESMNRIDSIRGINGIFRDEDGSYVISVERLDYICTTYEEFYKLVCYIKKRFNDENEVYSFYDLRTGEAVEI